jgi:hypothetical protein
MLWALSVCMFQVINIVQKYFQTASYFEQVPVVFPAQCWLAPAALRRADALDTAAAAAAAAAICSCTHVCTPVGAVLQKPLQMCNDGAIAQTCDVLNSVKPGSTCAQAEPCKPGYTCKE